MSSKIENLTEKDFSKVVKNKVTLVEFWATWCHACKTVEPHLEELAKSWNDKIIFYKVNVTQNPGLASRMGIMSLPNILFFRHGKVIEQIIGLTNKKTIEEKIKKILK